MNRWKEPSKNVGDRFSTEWQQRHPFNQIVGSFPQARSTNWKTGSQQTDHKNWVHNTKALQDGDKDDSRANFIFMARHGRMLTARSHILQTKENSSLNGLETQILMTEDIKLNKFWGRAENCI